MGEHSASQASNEDMDSENTPKCTHNRMVRSGASVRSGTNDNTAPETAVRYVLAFIVDLVCFLHTCRGNRTSQNESQFYNIFDRRISHLASVISSRTDPF